MYVYNDRAPAWAQPQTPADLPHARHEARQTYTAPNYGARYSVGVRRLDPTTPSRGPRYRRRGSPIGSRTPGEEGLYGGRENLDDASLYTAAEMRRLQAERRRLGLEAASPLR